MISDFEICPWKPEIKKTKKQSNQNLYLNPTHEYGVWSKFIN